jgi:glutamyl-tRNA synthetase
VSEGDTGRSRTPTRARFAPSPTGLLHVGNARTALFNWLFTRHEKGVFVLRIEDTDVTREQAGAETAIFEDLAWMGLDWDEGPDPAGGSRGEYGPYRQSERGAHYARALAQLAGRDAVYPCFCAQDQLDTDRRAALASGRTPGYTGRCAGLDAEAAAARAGSGEPHAIRFRVGRYGVVRDLLRGEVDFRAREARDPVIVRRDGRPTYNFAVVVDDAAMAITHVLRGEDHLTNTALQVRLYESLGLVPPLFAHLPLILGSDGSPLSKRHGASSVGEMRARGTPPEALVGSLALLGWTPPDEADLLDRDAMAARFELRAVNPAAAVFDTAKLDSIGARAIKAMDPALRGRQVGLFLRAAGLLSGPGAAGPPDSGGGGAAAPLDGWLADLGDLLATSLSRFDLAPTRCGFLFDWSEESALASGALEGEGAKALEVFAALFEAAGGVAPGSVPGFIEAAKSATGLKGRPLLHPLRSAVTGEDSGPDLARLLPIVDAAAKQRLAHGLVDCAARIRRVLARREGSGAVAAP